MYKKSNLKELNKNKAWLVISGMQRTPQKYGSATAATILKR